MIDSSPLRRLGSPSTALLPLRFFFGATFLWAGLDKLLDPAFFDPAAPTSLHAQLVAFERASPLGGLIGLMLPFATILGLLIAVGEIGIGIGALTGLAFRVAALGGAALSFLLWLTASWGTHPYYLGADLPYAIGWIALAIGGPGDRFVPARWRPASPSAPAFAGLSKAQRRRAARFAPRSTSPQLPQSPERRALLQTATLAAAAAIVASFAPFLSALGIHTGEGSRPGASGRPSAGPGATASGEPARTAPPVASPTTLPPGAVPIATVAAVTSRGSASFVIPFDAPAPLPAGDPGVIVALKNGAFAAFDAVCTHAGCTVEWDRQDHVIFCPCHDAIFDAEHQAAVLGGPAPAPLASLPIVIDPATGKIYLDPTA